MSNHTLPSPTHLVSFYGLRCYLDDQTGSLWAVRVWLDWLIPWICAAHNVAETISATIIPGWESQGFPYRVLKEFSND